MKRLFFALFTLCFLSAHTAWAEEPMTEQQIRDLYKQATDHANKREGEEARKLYLQIWKERQTYDTALNLAQIAFASGDFVSAAEYSRKGLDMYPPSAPSHVRDHYYELYMEARAEIASVSVEAPEGAEVRVDGKAVGTAPVKDLFIEPGKHRFEAVVEDEVATEELSLAKGDALTISLGLPKTGSDSDDGAPTKEKPRRPKLVPIVAGGAVALVGLGMGTGFAVAAKKKGKDADELLGELGGSDRVCGAGTPVADDCTEIRNLLNDRDRARDVAIWSFAVAGTATAATLAYVLWPRKDKKSSVQVQPTAAGVWLTGRF